MKASEVEGGVVTVDGRQIGRISLCLMDYGDERDEAAHDFSSPQRAIIPASFEAGRASSDAGFGASHPHLREHLHGGEVPRDLGSRSRPGEIHPNRDSRRDSGIDVGDVDVPASARVYGGFAERRDRAREELAANPALKEKMFSIAAGENLDPTANQAVMESMINRAAVRGTDLETQVRRYGHERGGYYAGYNPNYSQRDRAVMERSLARTLNYGNVSNYATDNSSNQPGNNLAERDVASGRFQERSVHNREHFFRPLGSDARHRAAWERLATESEVGRKRASAKAAADSDPNSNPM